MKQYLTENQSVKLRVLGFPQRTHFIVGSYGMKLPRFTYSVGDLLEFLPKKIDEIPLSLRPNDTQWQVGYNGICTVTEEELVDALFNLIMAPFIMSVIEKNEISD